ncbi:hypothetical protein Taro_027890 [Colocasia esculenta]|uniref:Uncharacterized protein n=1 Tax=Colocasia esculenta TaxID=4460 RepID=A0A843VQ55_COLES|nr:hypothetical protein [Colocasia esculenta]
MQEQICVHAELSCEAGACVGDRTMQRLELAWEGAEAPGSLFKDPRSSDLHKKCGMEIGLDI